MKLIGIYGGTFNPIHLGHVDSAISLSQEIPFEKIILVPNAIQPHKSGVTITSEDRLNMVNIAIKKYPKLHSSNYEIQQARLNGRPSFTIETVKHFTSKLKQDEKLIFILGTDSYRSLESWHQFEEITKLVSLVVLDRASEVTTAKISDESKLQPTLTLNELCHSALIGTYFANNKRINISSTTVRHHLAITENVNSVVSSSLDENVLEYIKKNHLYQCK